MGTFLISLQTGTRLASAWLISLMACALAQAGEPRLRVALTFDDLPINGTLPEGKKQSDFARDTIKVLKKHRIPPSHGFINANKLERNPDGAKALQIWVAGGHPLANHTYNHLDLTRSSVEDFQREILRNEPALSLLMPDDGKLREHGWRWFRYPFLDEGKDAAQRAPGEEVANNPAQVGSDDSGNVTGEDKVETAVADLPCHVALPLRSHRRHKILQGQRWPRRRRGARTDHHPRRPDRRRLQARPRAGRIHRRARPGA